MCILCNKKLKHHLLEDHFKEHNLKIPHNCTLCRKTFSAESTAIKHLLEHTENISVLLSKQSPSFHEDRHSDKIPCDKCGKHFNCRKEMQIHLATNHAEGLYACKVCKMECFAKCSLEAHMKIHDQDDITQFICEFCGKNNDKLCTFGRHKRQMHERKFQCEVCGAQQTTYRHLRKHLLTHDTTSGALCKHFQMHTEIDECKVVLVDLKYNKSIKLHSDGIAKLIETKCRKKYKCYVCFSKFATSAELTTHKIKHGNQYKEEDTTRQEEKIEEYVINPEGKADVAANEDPTSEDTHQVPLTCNSSDSILPEAHLKDKIDLDQVYPSTQRRSINVHEALIEPKSRKKYKCYICFSKFATSAELATHKIIHKNEYKEHGKGREVNNLNAEENAEVAENKDTARPKSSEDACQVLLASSFSDSLLLEPPEQAHLEENIDLGQEDPSAQEPFTDIQEALIESRCRKKYKCYICFSKFATSAELATHKIRHRNEYKEVDTRREEKESNKEENNQYDINQQVGNEEEVKVSGNEDSIRINPPEDTHQVPLPSNSSESLLPEPSEQAQLEEIIDLDQVDLSAQDPSTDIQEAPYKCVPCNKLFANQSDEVSTQFEPTTCDQCFDVFTSKAELDTHMQLHKMIREPIAPTDQVPKGIIVIEDDDDVQIVSEQPPTNQELQKTTTSSKKVRAKIIKFTPSPVLKHSDKIKEMLGPKTTQLLSVQSDPASKKQQRQALKISVAKKQTAESFKYVVVSGENAEFVLKTQNPLGAPLFLHSNQNQTVSGQVTSGSNQQINPNNTCVYMKVQSPVVLTPQVNNPPTKEGIVMPKISRISGKVSNFEGKTIQTDSKNLTKDNLMVEEVNRNVYGKFVMPVISQVSHIEEYEEDSTSSEDNIVMPVISNITSVQEELPIGCDLSNSDLIINDQSVPPDGKRLHQTPKRFVKKLNDLIQTTDGDCGESQKILKYSQVVGNVAYRFLSHPKSSTKN